MDDPAPHSRPPDDWRGTTKGVTRAAIMAAFAADDGGDGSAAWVQEAFERGDPRAFIFRAAMVAWGRHWSWWTPCRTLEARVLTWCVAERDRGSHDVPDGEVVTRCAQPVSSYLLRRLIPDRSHVKLGRPFHWHLHCPPEEWMTLDEAEAFIEAEKERRRSGARSTNTAASEEAACGREAVLRAWQVHAGRGARRAVIAATGLPEGTVRRYLNDLRREGRLPLPVEGVCSRSVASQ